MSITYSLKGVPEINKRLSNLRAYVVRISNAPIPSMQLGAAIDASVDIAKEKYASPSNPPHYPLRWKSQKQRKYVMAKLRKEGNIPYRRRGRLETAWSGGQTPKQITIANTARGDMGQFIAPFVIGENQQPFHADTGWQKRTAQIERGILGPIFVAIQQQVPLGIANSKTG